jgi:hypothetical protein
LMTAHSFVPSDSFAISFSILVVLRATSRWPPRAAARTSRGRPFFAVHGFLLVPGAEHHEYLEVGEPAVRLRLSRLVAKSGRKRHTHVRNSLQPKRCFFGITSLALALP